MEAIDISLRRFVFPSHESGSAGRIIHGLGAAEGVRRRQKPADAERGKPQLALPNTLVVVEIERPVEGVDARLFGGVYHDCLVAPLDDRAAEDGHIDVGQGFQPAFERLEIALDEAQLIQRAHPPYRSGGCPHSARGSLDELQQAARSLSGKGIAGNRVEQRLARHHIE